MEKLLEGMVIEILISFNVKEIWRDGWGVRKKYLMFIHISPEDFIVIGCCGNWKC